MVEATDARAAIRDELEQMALGYLGRWDEFTDKTYTRTTGDFELTSRQTEYQPGVFLTMTKARVPGLRIQMHNDFRANIQANLPKLDSKLSVTPVGEYEGYPAVIQHIKMPMMMTNRSIPIVNHRIEKPDGSLVIIGSSKGTEALVAAQKSVIKKDVVANQIISYLHLEEYEGGCSWTAVSCMDIAGSIPDMVRRQGAEKQLKSAENMILLLTTGSVPK